MHAQTAGLAVVHLQQVECGRVGARPPDAQLLQRLDQAACTDGRGVGPCCQQLSSCMCCHLSTPQVACQGGASNQRE